MSEPIRSVNRAGVVTEFHAIDWRDYGWSYPPVDLDRFAQAAADGVVRQLAEDICFDIDVEQPGGPLMLKAIGLSGYLTITTDLVKLIRIASAEDGWSDETMAVIRQALRDAADSLERT